MIDDLDLQNSSESTESLVNGLVDNLVAALINSRIYWTDHPRVVDSINLLLRQLRELCEQEKVEAITIAATCEFLAFDGRPLVGASLGAARLIATLRSWQSGGIRLKREASIQEFDILLEAINEQRGEDDTFDKINARLGRSCEVPSIELLPEYQDFDGASRDGSDNGPDSLVPVKLYQSVMSMLEGITVSVSIGGTIDFASVDKHAEAMLKRLNTSEGSMLSLAREDQYDAFTFGHSVRVSLLALNFARSLTDDEENLIRLGRAALLHDVGKAMVPFELLHSSQFLSKDERTEINKHPEYGAQILIDHADSDPHAIAAAFGHHYCTGDHGYPKTLIEHDVSIITKIVGIVDVFEALTAARPYKKAMSPIRAYRIMMGMGDRFDPLLLRRFIEVNGIYPSGQLVEMSTGEWARVESQTGKVQAPCVKIISDREGHQLALEDQWALDLSQQDPAKAATVAKPLPGNFLETIAG